MRPPRWADALARRLLPPGDRGHHMLGDLREEWATDARRGPALATLRMVGNAVEIRLRLGRSKRGGGVMPRLESMGRTCRQAARSLLRAPAYSATAVVTLALGLTAFTTVLAVTRAVLLQPPPFADPEGLVALRVADTDDPGDGVEQSYLLSFPQFVDVTDRSRTLEATAAWLTDAPVLEFTDGVPPLRIQLTAVTGGFFDVTGLEAEVGRLLQPADQNADAPLVAVLSHRLWRSRYGGDPAVVGRSLSVNGVSYEVVGVLTRAFQGLPPVGTLPTSDTDVWIAYGPSYFSSGRSVRGLHNVSVLARLAPNSSLEGAGAELRAVSDELSGEFEEHVDERVFAVPVQELLSGPARGPVALLFAGCAIVLLLAVMNVAALTLTRTSARGTEMAVREALGGGFASRAGVLLAESAWLAGGGVAGGVGLSVLLLSLARAAEPGLLPRLSGASLDLPTLGVAAVVGGLAALLVGLLPVARLGSPGRWLRSARGTTGGGQRLRSALVVAQIAGTVVLLTSTGLILRSLGEAARIDPGFRSDGVLMADLRMPTPFVSPEWPQHVDFFRTLADRLARLPGVDAVGLAYQSPIDEGWNNGFDFADRPREVAGRGPSAIYRPVDAGYFATLGIPVVEGRGIEPTDRAETAPVAVVNEAFAARYFEPGAPVVGTRVDYGDFWGRNPGPLEIVGIVADVRFAGPTAPVPPAIYLPHAQQPVREMTVFLRTRGEPRALVEPLQGVVADLRPDLPLDDVAVLGDEVRARSGPVRFLSAVTGTLAAVALTLALVGLYGVLSYGVELRRREIGIRLAIGAEPGGVVRSLLFRVAALVAFGLGAGAGLTVATVGLLDRLLFGVTPADPVTWIGAVGLLSVLAATVGLLPALRAARIDPIQALRGD